jgi:hypothetical protein
LNDRAGRHGPATVGVSGKAAITHDLCVHNPRINQLKRDQPVAQRVDRIADDFSFSEIQTLSP